MLIKQKRDVKIKGQTLYGGKKQQTYIPKEDASSPTVSTQWVLLTSIVDSEVNKDVGVIDISNAFIQMHVKEK